jgi:hypothetical protein
MYEQMVVDGELGTTWKETVVSPSNVSQQFHDDSEEKQKRSSVKIAEIRPVIEYGAFGT